MKVAFIRIVAAANLFMVAFSAAPIRGLRVAVTATEPEVLASPKFAGFSNENGPAQVVKSLYDLSPIAATTQANLFVDPTFAAKAAVGTIFTNSQNFFPNENFSPNSQNLFPDFP
jgi:hypothetical protein